jgi:hypothetical protein
MKAINSFVTDRDQAKDHSHSVTSFPEQIPS